ncbi:MAG: hypothetical protein HXY34_11320 [Candidatus Thorarchaeota archaeon]|nr:hypothetical protein [Candidatus Thorarchaeota archaeon]
MTRLQAMRASNEVSGFICSRLPSGRLESGCIEQGLFSKGTEGELRLRTTQVQTLIPADRTVRLFTERGVLKQGDYGILMLGEPGLHSPRFNVYLGNDSSEGQTFRYCAAFWTVSSTPDRVLRIVLNEALGVEPPQSSTVFTDYVEEVREAASMGLVKEALAMAIPRGKFKPSEWVSEATAAEEDEKVPLKVGELKLIPSLAPVVTTWILGLELVRNTRDRCVAAIMSHDGRTESCLWDGLRSMALFMVTEGLDANPLLLSTVQSMWSSGKERDLPPKVPQSRSDDTAQLRMQDSSSPSLVESERVERGQDKTTATPSDLDQLTQLIRNVPVAEILSRLAHVEQRVESISTRTPSSPDESGSRSLHELTTSRLKEVVERLERLSERLEDLEKRIARFASKTG